MNALLRVCTAAIALLWSGVAGAESVARVGVSARDMGALDPAFGIGNGDGVARYGRSSALWSAHRTAPGRVPILNQSTRGVVHHSHASRKPFRKIRSGRCPACTHDRQDPEI